MAATPLVPQGYQAISDEETKKAKGFFDLAKDVGDKGQFEYAIEMYLSGLKIDPENVEAHQALRDFSLKRKASGGGDLGMKEKWGIKTNTSDERANLLAAEKLLAYDPGNTDRMVSILQSAHRAGFYDTVLWIGAILFKANSEGKKPDFNKFIILKDVYKAIDRYKEAVDACYMARKVRPNDMELVTEAKNLSALLTMSKGNYLGGKSFRDSIRDMEGQKKLLDQDKDVRTSDSLMQAVHDAEADVAADPNEPGKLSKLVDALVRTERDDMEERALTLLDEAYARTNQFRWRLKRGQIALSQLSRQERMLRTALQKEPNNAELKKDYHEFNHKKMEAELAELTEWVNNYPTDSNYRFEMGRRLFSLGRFDESIPVFQQVRNDPKFRSKAAILLGRAFYESGFLDEAVDTLKSVMDEYQIKGDEISKDLYYWYGRVREQMQSLPEAIKAFSQVTMWDFNYRDVQARIKRLRAGVTQPPTA